MVTGHNATVRPVDPAVEINNNSLVTEQCSFLTGGGGLTNGTQSNVYVQRIAEKWYSWPWEWSTPPSDEENTTSSKEKEKETRQV